MVCQSLGLFPLAIRHPGYFLGAAIRQPGCFFLVLPSAIPGPVVPWLCPVIFVIPGKSRMPITIPAIFGVLPSAIPAVFWVLPSAIPEAGWDGQMGGKPP